MGDQRQALSALLEEAIRIVGTGPSTSRETIRPRPQSQDRAAENVRPRSQMRATQDRAAENFRRYFPSINGLRHTPYSANTSRNRRVNAANGNNRPRFPTSATWTHDVCVLASKDDNETPTREQLDQLKLSGLGKKRLVFSKHGDHGHFIKKLEEEFPKLARLHGGIEVLRASIGGAGQRPLTVVPLGQGGYCIPELKCAFAGAGLFVRPMQIDLDQSVTETNTTPAFAVDCIHCGSNVPLNSLREHQESSECLSDIDDDVLLVDAVPSRNPTSEVDDEAPGPSNAALSRNQISEVNDEAPGPSNATLSRNQISEVNDEAPGPSHAVLSRNQISDFNDETPGPSSSTNNACDLNREVEILSEMFPLISKPHLLEVTRRNRSIDSAVEELIHQPNVTADTSLTFKTILMKLKGSVGEEEVKLTVHRDDVWCGMLGFYKKAIRDPAILNRRIHTTFDGEDGIDLGALTIEFFHLALEEVKKRLFQGPITRVVPVKDKTRQMLFQLAGMLIGHSIKLDGPGFPCLNPAAYKYIAGKIEEIEQHISKEDIPLTASSEPVLNLIDALDGCSSQDQLASCLDSDTNWTLIAASHWPDTQIINTSNKAAVVANLVKHELLWSRKQELDEFSKGLDRAGILPLLHSHPDACEKLFCYNDKKGFGPAEFESCIIREPPADHEYSKKHAYNLFNNYISENIESERFPGGSRLRALLRFATGYKDIPPSGRLPQRITVEYLEDDDEYQLPMSQACFGILRIPTVHASQKRFEDMMDAALAIESMGFQCI